MADGFSRGLTNAAAIALTLSLVAVVRRSGGAMGKVTSQTADQPPHIVIMLADDLGWNDVSFHGSDQIPTPNIDALAYNGIILNQHYVPALCTPSRSALMTGKHPIHTGMQHLVILEAEPWGLPLQETILPEYLKQAGYTTHAIGKWHLGFFRKEYTPLYRGFDTHFGYYQGFQDYFDHSVKATFAPYDGYDMRRNSTVDWSSRGHYSTELFTEEAVNLIEHHDPSTPMFLYIAHLAPHTGNMREPFQAPDSEIAKFAHIDDPERRVYAAMVSKLDESVGDVVAALRAKGMLDNSIIVFMADNGAPTHGIHSNRGSNYPLRGIKETPWEGGTRGVAAIWSPHLKHTQRVSHEMMYMTDWLPTLYSAAGMDVRDLGNIDGVDMWKSLVENEESPRKEFVYNIDDIGDAYAAIRKGDWKYVTGGVQKGAADSWYGESGREETEVEYDVNSVLRSRAGVSLAGFITKQQIKEKIQRKAAENHVNKPEFTGRKWKLLVEDTVQTLRRQAEVRCASLNVTNNNALFLCHPHDGPCLFNIRTDPCETVNLAHLNPDIISDMKETVVRYRKTAVKPNNVPSEPEADPSLWNGTWVSWRDEIESVILDDADKHQLIRNTIMAGAMLLAVVAIIAVILRLSVPPNDRLKSPTDMTSVVSIFRIANNDQSNSKKTQMGR